MSEDFNMNDIPEIPAPDSGKDKPSGKKLPPGMIGTIGAVVVGIVMLYVVGYVGIWKWGICRVYVNAGETLFIRAKFGEPNPDPDNQMVVAEGVQGVREKVYGEGRHFFNPIWYETDTTSEVIQIDPGYIGLVESKSGKPLPEGEFLAGPGYRGIMREVLTPGKWRLNPIAFEVTPILATNIRPGFVGCVTSLSGPSSNPGELAKKGQRGILAEVLQPGIHYINPREFKVDVVEIGYRQISLRNAEFPSKDGFAIKLDISVVWGIEPANVPHIINNFGNLDAVVEKVIYPQVESICRIEGSKYGAKELIEGKTRERFQNTFTSQLETVCEEKNISVLIGLVREINIPQEVRLPIQQGKIAVEEKLTKEQQRTTQTVKNDLEELKADVRKGVLEVEAETTKMVAETRADGDKQVAQIQAQAEVQVASIELEVAKLEAQRERLLGKTKAEVEELMQTAQADELAQNIEALGSPDDYARYIFARNLPDDIKIYLRYAGEGTLWTDLPEELKSMEKLAAMKILEKKRASKKR